MCHALNARPDVAAFGETMFWGKSYLVPDAAGCYDARALEQVQNYLRERPLESTFAIDGPGRMQRLSRAQINDIVAIELVRLGSRPTPAEVFTHLCKAVARAEGKRHWVEKTPHHLLYASRILKHLPNAKFVIMVREPYSFVRSYRFQAGHGRTAESSQRFARRYHPLAGAIVWRNSWRAANQLMRYAPERALLVRLEDVESDPTAVLRRVQSFFEIEALSNDRPLSRKVNSAFYTGAASRAVSDADIGWMNWVAAHDIAAAGYTVRPRQGDFSTVARSVLALPVWLWYATRDLKRTTRGSVLRHALRWLSRPSPAVDKEF
jgi:hypothetical protein